MKKCHLVTLILLSSITILAAQQQYRVDENKFVTHRVDPSEHKLKFFWKDNDGKIFGSIDNLKNTLESNNKELLFATNGGMYMADQNPQGLFIHNGKLINDLDTIKSGYGNFYLQPNGVFYLTKAGDAHVIRTVDLKINSDMNYATQSGPMLLIDGDYHPSLIKGSANLHIRNGVGILPNGDVLFAMSKNRVNFYDLATLFKQNGCENALYLDGFVSRTYLPFADWIQLDGSFGVMIGEIEDR